MSTPTAHPTTVLIATLALTIALLATPCMAQDAPRVVDIRIVGNTVTRDRVIEREMAVAVGDPATGQALANSRQAIQDLGLFREVRIDEEPADGGVALVVHVREKRYFLPIPRLDTSSDLDYTYGAQLRWSNVGGRNHRMIAYVEETRYKDDRNRDSSRSARIDYHAPFIGDSPYSLRFLVDHTEQVTINRRDPGPDDSNTFDETFQRLEALVTRDFRDSRPRRGWVLGTGLYWHDQSTRGVHAPPSDGTATALVGTASYDDTRFNVYSHTGRHFDARVEIAIDGVASDFGYERLELDYRDYRQIGSVPHQTVHLLASGGTVTSGPRSRNSFSLGGSSKMRGYESDAIEGDSYWYVSGEYLRPIRWNWLRLLAVAEAGSARRNVFDERNRSAYASIGLGVRARITWFVDLDLEIGIAMPLVDGDGPRLFARSF